MSTQPTDVPNPALGRLPARVLEAFERFRARGDPAAVEAVVMAAVVDYRPAGSGATRPIGDATLLIDDLGYDSVSVAELVFFLEDLFEVTVTNEDIQGVRTIGELRSCVARKLAEKPGAA
jgi:3-hydroxyacyl-[acyl-carrier-protein] dehydratase